MRDEGATRAERAADTVSSRPLVAMFLRGTFRNDARVTREATTLIADGYDVVIFAAAAGDGSDAGESWEGPIRVVRLELHTAVRALVRWLGRMIGRYARAVRLTKRLILRARGVKTPLRSRDVAAPPAMPPSVESAQAARRRLWEILAPVQGSLQVLRFARVAGDRAAAIKPVAYHCHDLNAVPAGYRARRLHPAPLIYDAHELWPHRNRPQSRRRHSWSADKADRFFARSADAVITVNDSIARHMERRYKLKRPVVVVRNIPPLATRAEIPVHARIDDATRPRLAYVGGLRRARGLEQIVDALPLMPAGVFVVLGAGPDAYRHELRARAQDLGVGDRVLFVDPVPIEAVVSTIAQCDIGLSVVQGKHLSYYLSLPNKIFEYLHAGIAVVGSDFPETRALIEERKIGAVCDPGSPADIARAVNELLSRPDELARMRKNALSAARELNWERERERLLALYGVLVGHQTDA